MAVNRQELTARISARYPNLTERDVDLAVGLILGAVGYVLAGGGRTEIRGFGSFSLARRGAREARNPKTGEQISVPEKNVPHFKPGKELRERISGNGKTGT